MNYAIGVATQYSTASEARGCRHSTSVLRVLVIIECRHPVASLAVLYLVAIMLVSFLTRLIFHTVSPVGGIDHSQSWMLCCIVNNLVDITTEWRARDLMPCE